MQTAVIFGVIAAATACADSRGTAAKNAEPPRIEAVLAALDARADACRKKGDAEPPAKCIAGSPPVATEPALCAEYQESATTEHKSDGSDVVIARGSWRELANWDLIDGALLRDLPVIGNGRARSRPLSTMVPSNPEAPLPRPGHFLPAFAAFGKNAVGSNQDDLVAAEREAQTVEQTIDTKLSWRTAPSATPIHWSRYSRACMEVVTTAAAVLEHDLAQATSSVRFTRERNDVASWLTASLAQCESQLSEAGCASAPNFATADDRAACSAGCAKHLAEGTEKAFKASVKACAETYASSEDKPAATTCTFTLPPGSTANLESRAAACGAACEAAGKQLIAEADERARAKKESAYLLYAYRGCIRAAQKTPEHAKARAGDKAKYEKAVAQETKACRYQSKCDWLEKFTEKTCKAD